MAGIDPLVNRSSQSMIPHVLVFAACSAMLIGIRLLAFSLPLENDECNYAYIAERLLAGDRLYADVWDHQPPGVFVLFAAVTRLIGQSDAIFRWTAIAFSLVTLGWVQAIAYRLCGLRWSIVAAAAFALVSADPGTAGEGCNREIYMNALTLGGFWFATTNRPGVRNLLTAGVLLGIASTFKTVVAAQWIALALWAAIHRHRAEGRVRDSLAAVAVLAIGPILVWSAVFAYFAASGRWSAFTEAVFQYNLGYAGVSGGFGGRFADFFLPVFDVFSSAWPLWTASAVAWPALVILNRGRLASRDGAIIAFAMGTFLAVCLPGRFWPHYYYLLLPVLVLTCVAVTGRLTECFATVTGARFVYIAAWCWIGIVGIGEWRHYLQGPPDSIIAPHRIYRYRQAWARAQGERVKALTEPNDTVFAWGQDAGIYYYSARRCASRFTMVGALEGRSAGIDQRRQILLDELRANRPRLVLIVEPEFDALRDFLQSNYVLAGPHAIDHHDDKPAEIIMVALMDPKRPVESIDWEWPPRR